MSSANTKEFEQKRKSSGGIVGNMDPVDFPGEDWAKNQIVTVPGPTRIVKVVEKPHVKEPLRSLKRIRKRDDATKQILVALVENNLINPATVGEMKEIFKKLTVKQMYALYISVSKCVCD